MEMSLSEINYCIEEENKKRLNEQRNLIKLAWFTAYFTRIERLESLSKYLEPLTSDYESKKEAEMDIEEAEKIYNKIFHGKENRNA